MSDDPTPSTDGRTAVAVPGLDTGPTPYSPAVKAGGWVFVSGQTAPPPAIDAHAETEGAENPFLEDPLERQSRGLLSKSAAILEAAGCDIGRDVVRIYQWFNSPWPNHDEYERGDRSPRTPITITPYLRVRDEFIADPRPASTGVRVREALAQRATVSVDMIAMEPRSGTEKRGTGVPAGEPSPLAGYAPAIHHGDWVFLAGMVATDFQGDFGVQTRWGDRSALAPDARVNPDIWYDVSIERQTDYTLQRLHHIAEEAGTSLDRCVKATVYLGDPSELAGMDRVWREWFPNDPPARVVLPYILPGLRGTRVEIAMKLLGGDSDLELETIETSDAPEPIGHEPQAVRAGNLLFLSTQQPSDSSGRLARGLGRDADHPHASQPAGAQMRYMLDNAAAIFEAAGSSLENLCRQMTFYDDLRWFGEATAEWSARFPADPPAGTSLAVGGPLAVPGAHMVADLTGYVPA